MANPLPHPASSSPSAPMFRQPFADGDTPNEIAIDMEDRHVSPPSPAERSRHRRMTVYQSRESRSRWVLHMQAVFWRVLMSLGMFFHRLAPPRPPKPNFSRVIPSTLAARPGTITLHFYVPRDYATQRLLWINRPGNDAMQEYGDGEDATECNKGKSKRVSMVSNVGQSLRRRSLTTRKWGGYPVIINFHGGGFTLGSAMDDARWCGTVVDECNAVVVSVDYRLAPECPFPTAVEDGVDAVLYIHEHAEELGIDREKIGLSGFSSGGNMAFTVPLRLYDEIAGFPRDDTSMYRTISRQATATGSSAALVTAPQVSSSPADNESTSSASTAAAAAKASHIEILDPNDPPPTTASTTKSPMAETITEDSQAQKLADINIRCIIPWYPPVDYTRSREQRRATCARKDQELPALFTNLFDDSYLHPPHTIALDSPYLSPGVAPTSLLRNALPAEIIMHTCEWDMLLDEGAAFRDRLSTPEIGKHVFYHMVPDVPHGWDKAPNPWKPTPGVREHYLRACREIRRIMMPSTPSGRPLLERQSTVGPSAAPRDSVVVVR